MANTTLSSIGGVIQSNFTDEHIVGALGDGTAKAGNAVGILSTGKVVQSGSAGTDDEFIGFLLPNFGVDMDTAITASQPCSVVIPQSGHLYGVTTADLGTSKPGYPLIHDATDGQLDKVGTGIEDEHIARLYRGTDDDTYQIIIWQ